MQHRLASAEHRLCLRATNILAFTQMTALDILDIHFLVLHVREAFFLLAKAPRQLVLLELKNTYIDFLWFRFFCGVSKCFYAIDIQLNCIDSPSF